MTEPVCLLKSRRFFDRIRQFIATQLIGCFATLAFLGCSGVFVAPSPSRADDKIQAARDNALVQTLLRLPNVDVNAKPKLRDAVLRHLATKKGTAEYVDLVGRLKLKGVEPALLEMAINDPDGNAGVQAAALLIKRGDAERFAAILEAQDEATAVKAATVLGLVASSSSTDILRPIVTDATKGRALRVAASAALGRSRSGQQFLLKLARESRLTADLHFVVGNALLGSANPAIRAEAAQQFQLPAGADAKPLPPVARLLQMEGNVGRGHELFKVRATCSKCHRVDGQGKEIGPDLSEIGSKLSREALFTSILDPSAGISHNYETYAAVLEDGNLVTGVLVNRTDEAVVLRTAEAIDRTYDIEEIEELVKSPVSLMPADLQKLLSVQELVDVVQYLGSLKKRNTRPGGA
jgi:putative heme-binding domain-containing protein